MTTHKIDKVIVDAQDWRDELEEVLRDLTLCTGGHFREGLSHIDGHHYKTAISCIIAGADQRCPACAAVEFVTPAVHRVVDMKAALSGVKHGPP